MFTFFDFIPQTRYTGTPMTLIVRIYTDYVEA